MYYLIKLCKTGFKTFELDVLVAGDGHSVLRLPPHHPEINPIELVWGRLKDVSFRLHDGMKLAVEKFSITILLTTFRYRLKITQKTTVIPAVAAAVRGRNKLQKKLNCCWESAFHYSLTIYISRHILFSNKPTKIS
jgi:hypothetical protein